MSKARARVSERFCAPNADVTFRARDGVLIRIHRKNLDANTGGFLPAEVETRGEAVPLPETSTTLELLFQFIYPQKYPDLLDAEIDVLAPLAEAAEKYEVFAAMCICEIYMRRFKHTHPLEVLAYAVKHGHLDIVDEVAPVAIGLPPQDVVKILPQYLVIPWVLYYERWTKVVLLTMRGPAYCSCHRNRASYTTEAGVPMPLSWEAVSSKVHAGLAGGIGSLLAIDSLIADCSVSAKSCCRIVLEAWLQKAKDEMELVPGFQTFL